MRRTVLIADRLHYGVRVRNFHSCAVATTIELSLAADFADVFEVRGVDRRTSWPRPGRRRATETTCASRTSPPTVSAARPSSSSAPPPRERRSTRSGQHVAWDVELGAGEAISLLITVVPAHHARHGAPTVEQATAELQAAHDAWVSGCARVTTDNELFDRFIDASVRDLHALMMPAGGDQLPGSGHPVVRGAVRARLAADRLRGADDQPRGGARHAAGARRAAGAGDEAWRDAEPGKILHELRTGELARTGHIPHTPYYGTVDATPLFLMVAGGYYRWTLDLDTMAQLRPALDAALAWIDEWGDRDGDGFVEYERRSPAGLVNHGWKDSHDSVVHADGSLAQGPIALVEVQGYVYEAKLRIADVYEALGDRRARRPAAHRGRRPARRVQRGVLGPGGGVLRARAGRAQGTRCAASPPTPRTACTAGSSTTTRQRSSPSA